MKNNKFSNYLFIIFSTIFLISCSQKLNTDIDLSNLPKPKKINITQKENNQPINLKIKNILKI